MKKTVKTLLAAALILCASGGILYGAGIAGGGKTYVQAAELQGGAVSSEKGKGIKTYRMEKTQIDDIRALNVDLKHADFQIKPSADDHYYMEYTIDSRMNQDPISAEGKNGVLELAESRAETTGYYDQVHFSFFSGLFESRRMQNTTSIITLSIPEKKGLDTCTISMDEGDLDIDGLQAGKTAVTMSEGDMTLTNANLHHAGISLEDGDFLGENAAFSGNNQIGTELGDIELSLNTSCKKELSIHAETEGDLEIEGDLAAPGLDGLLTETDDQMLYEKTAAQEKNRLNIVSDDGDIVIR